MFFPAAGIFAVWKYAEAKRPESTSFSQTTLPSTSRPRLRPRPLSKVQVAKRKVVLPAGPVRQEWLETARALGAEVRQATVYLGACVGDPAAAAQLLHEEIGKTKATLQAILAAPVSLQTRWALTKTALSTMTWRVAVCSPETVAHIEGERASANEAADSAVHGVVFALADAPASWESAKTRRLLHAPPSVTGLGLPSFSVPQPLLHSSFFVAAARARQGSRRGAPQTAAANPEAPAGRKR
jgi:hypothetical protein